VLTRDVRCGMPQRRPGHIATQQLCVAMHRWRPLKKTPASQLSVMPDRFPLNVAPPC
jgi:hypothetical protein